MVRNAWEYPYSSAISHVRNEEDALVRSDAGYLLKLFDYPDWKSYLNERVDSQNNEEIANHIRTGWPMANKKVLEGWEVITSRVLIKKKPGPKAKAEKAQD